MNITSCAYKLIDILVRGDTTDSNKRSPTFTLSSLPEDAPHAKILRLLRVLYHLNSLESERASFGPDKRNLSDTAFVNNKLTAKLTRQLEEPMIVARWVLPQKRIRYLAD
jgi:E3 ubiquitin-protein ligase TRIP12